MSGIFDLELGSGSVLLGLCYVAMPKSGSRRVVKVCRFFSLRRDDDGDVQRKRDWTESKQGVKFVNEWKKEIGRFGGDMNG